ncbi:N-formylglutamate amidohydrolase [Kaustia mangrovi]|uniref:N-formylglutamate amidohydrolase n=1 Tax=Kaustia mangrovi TaxID=2593653 RepID=A0A7S8C2G9_9HYPH|nr:N-formylglutamate amidohydrolase [Kaustia mangrovi]QPC42175.1 N-formylglutamate amidohydrolase [Kaustia mangrovi]
MLDTRNSPDRREDAREEAPFAPFDTVEGDPSAGLVLICDHARNALPPEYGTLGLPPAELERHIGYDIGAEAVTRGLARRLGVPAVLSGFSRLLIDPNRGEDDPTLVMKLSDGAVVPGNAHADAAERERRLTRFYRPYHTAISQAVDRVEAAAGVPPAIVSIHSFTPAWKGVPRPWHVGVLWDRDDRLVISLLAALRAGGDLVVGDNEPYSGELEGDTLNRHGTARGLPHALIEIRQDLIADGEGVAAWIDRFAAILPGVVAQGRQREVGGREMGRTPKSRSRTP